MPESVGHWLRRRSQALHNYKTARCGFPSWGYTWPSSTPMRSSLPLPCSSLLFRYALGKVGSREVERSVWRVTLTQKLISLFVQKDFRSYIPINTRRHYLVVCWRRDRSSDRLLMVH